MSMVLDTSPGYAAQVGQVSKDAVARAGGAE